MTIILKPYFITLVEFSIIEFRGADTLSFFQGQFTQDINNIKHSSFKMASRLDRSGRIKNWFYVLNEDQKYYVLIKRDEKESFLDDLQKYIIAEEIVIRELQETPYFFSAPMPTDDEKSTCFHGFYLGAEGYISFKKNSINNFLELNKHQKRELEFHGLLADLTYSKEKSDLLNNSILLSWAYSSSKGCFLGQETVSKIISRKGSPVTTVFFRCTKDFQTDTALPLKISIDQKSAGFIIDFQKDILLLKLNREHSVDGLELNIETEQGLIFGQVVSIKDTYLHTFKMKSEMLFQNAIKLFNTSNLDDAKKLLLESLAFNPKNVDSIESYGVILGREGRYQEAIEWMDRLEEVEPQNIMSHTNKSLYYMKIGNIEKAEEEKSKATLLSFEQLGKEAQERKSREEEEKKVIEQREMKAQMFQKILKIDENDEFANLELTEIYFLQKKFNLSIACADKIIDNPKLSSKVFYYKACSLKELGEKQTLTPVIQAGIKRAKEKGENSYLEKFQKIQSTL